MKMLKFKSIAATACSFALVGCATTVDQLVEKPYCHTDRGRNAYCTKDNAPSLKRDEESKQFSSVPDALTVYIVRYWGDGHHPLEIVFDESVLMDTVPDSMIRLRVKAGDHRVSFKVGGKSFDRSISGMEGDVLMLGISGTDWPWGAQSHAWADDSDDQVKRKAMRSRLIGDMSLL